MKLLKLLKILKKRLMMELKCPDSYLIYKFIELDEKGKRNSLRARALATKLVKRGYSGHLCGWTLVADAEAFNDDHFFDDILKGDIDTEKLLSSIFGPKKPSLPIQLTTI